jgi:pimeloyl-ACP methyl ester carboxylesterase
MMYRRSSMAQSQEEMFFDLSPNSEHRLLINKQMSMVTWQLRHTPGYTGAILSTFRAFPLSGMSDLFAVSGRRDRPVEIIWGDNDNMFPFSKAEPVLSRSFPEAEIRLIPSCGHNPIFEKFDEVADSLVLFYEKMSE